MSSRPPLNAVGLRLSRSALRVLKERGILARLSVSLEHQHLAKRYLVRGVESGGAAGDVGHYVTFAQESGKPLQCFCPVETVGVNGPHAVVLAPVLIRIEMLRKAFTYELLISQHRPSSVSNGTRPQLESKVLFRGMGAWNSICQEKTNHALAQSCHLSVHVPERELVYRTGSAQRFERLPQQ